MSVRSTSLQVYQDLIVSGVLSKRRAMVYDFVYRNGPATAGEVAAGIGYHRYVTAPRCTELVELGVFHETQERYCPYSKCSTLEYDVTMTGVTGKVRRKKDRHKNAILDVLGVLDQTTPDIRDFSIQRIREICESVL